MTNYEVRERAKSAGVKLWQIAEELGMNDGNFSRKVRRELPLNEQQKIFEIIDRLEEARQ